MASARKDSKDHSKMNKVYKPSSSPKPAPSPTAVSQLKNVRATMMSIPNDEEGNSLQYTKKDLNTYSGTYKGKDYTWQKGKFTR